MAVKSGYKYECKRNNLNRFVSIYTSLCFPFSFLQGPPGPTGPQGPIGAPGPAVSIIHRFLTYSSISLKIMYMSCV